MLPLFIDLRGKKVVVFGGGEVGLRKARFFAEETEVTVVSIDFVPGFEALRVQKVEEDARSTYLEWVARSDFVVASTDDPELNALIAQAALAHGVWCNRADGISDFMIPSVVRRRNYVVAASTLGRSPAMSRYLRLRLEESLPERYDKMVDLQKRLREIAKERIEGQVARERFLWEVLSDESIWDALEASQERALELAEKIMEGYCGERP